MGVKCATRRMFGVCLGLGLLAPAAQAGRARVKPVPVVEQVQSSSAPSARLVEGELRTLTPAWTGGLAEIGGVGSLDLQTLGRTTLSFSLQVPDPGLDGLSKEAREALLRHLQADPRWRVTTESGVVVALRRRETAGGWTAAADGVHRDASSGWRANLRFGAWPTENPWASATWVQRSTFGADSVQLRATTWSQAPWKNTVATAISVSGSHVSLDLVEAGPAHDRAHTVTFLSSFDQEISQVVAAWDLVGVHGYVPFAMPPAEPAGVEGVELAVDDAGWLDVRARVAPGGAGWTWVRLMSDGVPWFESEIAACTRERLGDGAEPGKFFLLQSQFPVERRPTGTLSAEVWHLPDGAAAPRRLLVRPVVLKGG